MIVFKGLLVKLSKSMTKIDIIVACTHSYSDPLVSFKLSTSFWTIIT